MNEERTTTPYLTLIERKGLYVVPDVGYVMPFLTPGECAEKGLHAANVMCWRCNPRRRSGANRWTWCAWEARRCKR